VSAVVCGRGGEVLMPCGRLWQVLMVATGAGRGRQPLGPKTVEPSCFLDAFGPHDLARRKRAGERGGNRR